MSSTTSIRLASAPEGSVPIAVGHWDHVLSCAADDERLKVTFVPFVGIYADGTFQPYCTVLVQDLEGEAKTSSQCLRLPEGAYTQTSPSSSELTGKETKSQIIAKAIASAGRDLYNGISEYARAWARTEASEDRKTGALIWEAHENQDARQMLLSPKGGDYEHFTTDRGDWLKRAKDSSGSEHIPIPARFSLEVPGGKGWSKFTSNEPDWKTNAQRSAFSTVLTYDLERGVFRPVRTLLSTTPVGTPGQAKELHDASWVALDKSRTATAQGLKSDASAASKMSMQEVLKKLPEWLEALQIVAHQDVGAMSQTSA